MKNKIIWSYWHQGIENAPPLIKPCVQQWINLNPEWDLRFLSQYNMYDYIEPLDIKKDVLEKMSLAVSSDLFKLQLLIKYGGVWVDATTYPIIPLDEWLPTKMNAGYFFFYKPGRDRIISSWFIAAEQNDIMLIKLYDALKKYWNTNNFINLGKHQSSFTMFLYKFVNRNLKLTRLWFSPLFTKVLRHTPYLVTHYMFYNLLVKHKNLRRKFEIMPKITSDFSHTFNASLILNDLDENLKKIVDHKKTPVIKLNWSLVGESIPENSNLAYLFKQTKKVY